MPIPFLIPSAIAIATEFFPMLATKLAGKHAGELAETVVNTAATVAGLPPDASAKDIIARVKSSSEASEQLRFQFEQLNQEAHFRDLEDRQDARRYQASVGQEGRARGTYMLIGVSAGLTACILVASLPHVSGMFGGTSVELDPALLALVTTVAGALLKMLSDAFAFEFGSSRGSREKDTQLSDFREALVTVGRENRQAATEIIREQQQQVPNIAQQVIKATEGAAAAGAATVQTAVDSVLNRRDFVGQLVAGEV
jgi:hypothetical protein